ncbi:MAG: fucose isomerase [spirochete symbiont of Stewartia floridana]|nr:MAG: fucose isomerase [spirochete symbiont of Stewartia floridana]
MLRNISTVISPELLDALYRMGHGDEIVLADAFFAGDSLGKRVIRADGIKVVPLLEGIMPLITLDKYCKTPLFMMQPEPGDELDEALEREYRFAIDKTWPQTPPITRVERFAFYEQARKAFAVVMTGEVRKYANIILKKGVIDR